jgi:hypothetical protein
MYVILEYFTYLILLLIFGGVLFATSAVVLVTEEGAKLVAHSARSIALEASQRVSKHLKSQPAIHVREQKTDLHL